MVEWYLDVACRTDLSSCVSANGLAASGRDELAPTEHEMAFSEDSFLTSFSQDMELSISTVAKMNVAEIEISFIVPVFR